MVGCVPLAGEQEALKRIRGDGHGPYAFLNGLCSVSPNPPQPEGLPPAGEMVPGEPEGEFADPSRGRQESRSEASRRLAASGPSP
jgi:hypothetical protein